LHISRGEIEHGGATIWRRKHVVCSGTEKLAAGNPHTMTGYGLIAGLGPNNGGIVDFDTCEVGARCEKGDCSSVEHAHTHQKSEDQYCRK
jgi:hypothetical protein